MQGLPPETVWRNALTESHKLLTQFIESAEQIKKCTQLSDWLADLYRRNGNLFICGNGGSHCDSMHMAEEFTGRFRKDRRPLGALALGDGPHMSAVTNDMSFDVVFARQLQGLGRKGDLLVGISTSGNSKNVGEAIRAAKQMGIQTVALLGRDGGWIKNEADLAIVVPGNTSDRVQEMHIKIIHTAIEACERVLFPGNYASENDA